MPSALHAHEVNPSGAHTEQGDMAVTDPAQRSPGDRALTDPTSGSRCGAVRPRPGDGIGRRSPLGLPCHRHDPDLWFADAPADLERAKALCRACPVRPQCLASALRRREQHGVWGGEILLSGRIIPHKRGRGRPSKNAPPPT